MTRPHRGGAQAKQQEVRKEVSEALIPMGMRLLKSLLAEIHTEGSLYCSVESKVDGNHVCLRTSVEAAWTQTSCMR